MNKLVLIIGILIIFIGLTGNSKGEISYIIALSGLILALTALKADFDKK